VFAASLVMWPFATIVLVATEGARYLNAAHLVDLAALGLFAAIDYEIVRLFVVRLFVVRRHRPGESSVLHATLVVAWLLLWHQLLTKGFDLHT
jgi:hypothetical protein